MTARVGPGDGVVQLGASLLEPRRGSCNVVEPSGLDLISVRWLLPTLGRSWWAKRS